MASVTDEGASADPISAAIRGTAPLLCPVEDTMECCHGMASTAVNTVTAGLAALSVQTASALGKITRTELALAALLCVASRRLSSQCLCGSRHPANLSAPLPAVHEGIVWMQACHECRCDVHTRLHL